MSRPQRLCRQCRAMANRPYVAPLGQEVEEHKSEDRPDRGDDGEPCSYTRSRATLGSLRANTATAYPSTPTRQTISGTQPGSSRAAGRDGPRSVSMRMEDWPA